MRRHIVICFALMASLVAASALPTSAFADAAPKKKTYRSAKVSKGYGFLPGYRPPLPPNVPIYEAKRRGRHGAPRYYEPRYDDAPRVYMWGGTGNWTIYRNRPVGPIFGPCYKHTPIGPMWTCG